MNQRSFLRLLLGNLRLSFFLIVAAVGLVVGYALFMQEPAHWEIVLFLAAGMFLSSLLNAWFDSRRKSE